MLAYLTFTTTPWGRGWPLWSLCGRWRSQGTQKLSNFPRVIQTESVSAIQQQSRTLNLYTVRARGPLTSFSVSQSFSLIVLETEKERPDRSQWREREGERDSWQKTCTREIGQGKKQHRKAKQKTKKLKKITWWCEILDWAPWYFHFCESKTADRWQIHGARFIQLHHQRCSSLLSNH